MRKRIKESWDKLLEWQQYLKNRIMIIVLLCGILPVISIVIFVVISYRGGIIEKTESMVENEMRYAASLISGRLDDAVSVCQTPTYDEAYEDAWLDYQSGRKTEGEFYRNIKLKLRRLFNLDRKYDAFVFYEVNRTEPVCYNSRQGYSFKEYMKKIDPVIDEVREIDSPDARIIVLEGRIFIVRNLYTISEYQKFGTLAVEMNTASLFRDIKPEITEDMVVYLNDGKSRVMINGEMENENKKGIEKKLLQKFNRKESQMLLETQNLMYSGYMWNQSYDNYYMGIMYLAKNNHLYMELYDFYKIIVAVLVIMSGFFIWVIHFLKRHLSEPVTRMIEASKAIEEGAIGLIIEGEKMPNIEFEYLKDAFNKMSKQVKYLFDYAYDEKMARKDAKIMALQAQINPHFLNNTLEMMNWQARISGNLEVSSMIESLGIVLDYNMNRESKRLTSLAEELRCADAYFHIITKRFGKRLKVEKEIGQQLLQTRVPQLVLQPLIENAVVHGVEQVRTGTIKIKIYSDSNNIYLQVMNSGEPLTEERKQKIERLLNQRPEEIEKGTGHHVSLAIRNINERVKLIYGEKYGLKIEQFGEYIASTITIPIGKDGEEDLLENRERILKRLERTGRL